MKTFLKKFTTVFPAISLIVVLIFSAISCDKDELLIQNNFPFELKVMPVPKDIARGETIEIRIEVLPSGKYINSEYYIRYFQFDGKGTLQYFDEPAYLPNDLYKLPEQTFRLYYRSESAVSQSFEIWISDNAGKEKQLSFEFNNND